MPETSLIYRNVNQIEKIRQNIRHKPPSICGILLALFIVALPFTRDLSGLNLVVFSIFFLSYLFFAKELRSIPTSLLAFCLFSILYAILSLLNVFPATWTSHYEIGAIPQQALYAYSLPPIFGVTYIYLKEHLSTERGRIDIAKKLLIAWIYLQCIGVFFSENEIDVLSILSISTLGNTPSLAIVATCIYLSTNPSAHKKYAVIALFIGLSLLSTFSQNFVYALAFVLIWSFPKYSRILTISIVVFSVILYIAFYNNPFGVRFVDTNLTVRLLLLHDAISGLIQSYFIGVGFGTESISNDYSNFGVDIFRSEDDTGFIHLAVHNSFATIAFRVGFAGFVIFLYFLTRTFSKIRLSKTKCEAQTKYALFLAFFVLLYTNPALESFIYMYGASLYLATIWSFPERIAKSIPKYRAL